MRILSLLVAIATLAFLSPVLAEDIFPPSANFTTNGNSTVTHNISGKTWGYCSAEQVKNAQICINQDGAYDISASRSATPTAISGKAHLINSDASRQVSAPVPFNDTANRPANIGVGTAIKTNNNGYWRVTVGDYYAGSQTTEQVYVYSEGGLYKLSYLTSGVTFTVEQITPTKIDSVSRPGNMNPGTILMAVSGDTWKITSGSYYGGSVAQEGVVIYLWGGITYMSFDRSGVDMQVESVILSFKDTANRPANIGVGTAIKTNNNGYWRVTVGDYYAGSQTSEQAGMYNEGGLYKLSYLTSGVTFTVEQITPTKIDSVSRPANMNPGTILMAASGDIWKITSGSYYGGNAAQEGVVIYLWGGMTYMSFDRSGVDMQVLLISVGPLTTSTTALTATPVNSSFSGQTVTLTAQVTGSATPPTGSVEFRDGTTALGTVPLSGQSVSQAVNFMTSTLSVGNRNLSAIYSGNATYQSSLGTLNYSIIAELGKTLSVSRAGSGTVTSNPAGISCGSTCSATYTSGASVTLTATAGTGSTFTGWGGACSGASSTCTVSMSVARSVSATFTTTATTRQISLTKTGDGTVSSNPTGISCGASCSTATASYASSGSVTFTATPDSGNVLSSWTGGCTGTGTCTIAAGTTSVSLGATFVAGTPLTLTTASPATGTAGVDPAANLTFTFSAPIQMGTGTISIKTAAGAVFESYTVGSSAALSISGNTLTINPTKSLGIFTNYVVEMPLGTIKDFNGTSYAGLSSYTVRTATLDSLYNFFVVAFSAAPGATYMGQLAEAYNNPLTVQEIVNIFTAKPQFTDTYPTSMTHSQLATALINNVVKSSASDAVKVQGTSDVAGALDSGWTVGRTIFQVFGNLAAMPTTDASWGNTAKQFQNQLVVARYFTEVMANPSTDLTALRNVIARVDHNSDVSTTANIIALIGAVP